MALAAPAAAQEVEVQRQGSPPARKGPAETFVGSVWLEGPFRGRGDARVGGATVSFEPGARTAWHSHPLGQTLIVTRGCGLVQGEGSPPMAIRPGDVVWIPAGKPHWHGAAPSSSMSHVAISESLDGRSVTWMKHVEQQAYSDAARGSPC
ncbi:MAG: cupin domain-containing protein [Phenylobacterium sp.]|nr:cupin domain-containing protein [Phenylobacterium sp.]